MKFKSFYSDHGTPASPDLRPGAYYVSAIDGQRYALLAGPWATHQQALEMMEQIRTKAAELDSRAHFYAFGTARLPIDDESIPIVTGILNKYFPLEIP